MKTKLTIAGLILALFLLAWYGERRKKTQRTPEGTVYIFMETAEKMSNFVWRTREGKEYLLSFRKIDPGTGEHVRSLRAFYRPAEIEDPTILFKDKEYGKLAFSIFSLYKFGGFSIKETRKKKNEVEVRVQFKTEPGFGVSRNIRNLGGGKEEKKGPSLIPFYLQKEDGKWYIIDIGGREGRFIGIKYRYSYP